MSAGPGNQNAVKGAGPATSHLHVRCEPQDMAGWVKAAGGRKLSDWVVETLNAGAVLAVPGLADECGPKPPGPPGQ